MHMICAISRCKSGSVAARMMLYIWKYAKSMHTFPPTPRKCNCYSQTKLIAFLHWWRKLFKLLRFTCFPHSFHCSPRSRFPMLTRINFFDWIEFYNSNILILSIWNCMHMQRSSNEKNDEHKWKFTVNAKFYVLRNSEILMKEFFFK